MYSRWSFFFKAEWDLLPLSRMSPYCILTIDGYSMGMPRHLLWIQHHWMRHLSQLPMMSTKLRQIFFSIGVRSVAFCFHRLVTMQNWNWNFRPRCHRLQDQSAHHNTCNWAHLLHHVVHACIRCISTTSIDTILIIRCKGVRDLDVEVPHTNTIPLRVITQHNCTPDWKA